MSNILKLKIYDNAIHWEVKDKYERKRNGCMLLKKEEEKERKDMLLPEELFDI